MWHLDVDWSYWDKEAKWTLMLHFTSTAVSTDGFIYSSSCVYLSQFCAVFRWIVRPARGKFFQRYRQAAGSGVNFQFGCEALAARCCSTSSVGSLLNKTLMLLLYSFNTVTSYCAGSLYTTVNDTVSDFFFKLNLTWSVAMTSDGSHVLLCGTSCVWHVWSLHYGLSVHFDK